MAFIEHGPWVFGPRHTRFTRLRPPERVQALEDMLKSSIYIRRIAFLSIRTILSMGYLANAAVVQSIGCVAHVAPFDREIAIAVAAAPVVPVPVPAAATQPQVMA
jgi:hypothetical protein